MSKKTKVVESLTPEQEALFPQYCAKWIEIGLSTGRCDRPAVEALVTQIYEKRGLPKPETFIWVDGPSDGYKIASEYCEETNPLPTFYGTHEAGYAGWLDYYLEVVKLEDLELAREYRDLSAISGWVWCLEKTVICSERMSDIKMSESLARMKACEVVASLHCDGGPAYTYPNGDCGWFLNGVEVSQEIAETPADKLDPKLLVSETNVDVRRELLRKLGIERVEKALKSEKVDASNGYTLLDMQLSPASNGATEVKGRYLKMQNPSIDAIHIEGVPNTCKTVEEAIMFRNNLAEFILPSILS